MKEVFAGAENIISSLGFTCEENIQAILGGRSGIAYDVKHEYSPESLPLALIDRQRFGSLSAGFDKTYTSLEKMFILSVKDSLTSCGVDASAPDTLFLITTTKGNIELLDPAQKAAYGKDDIYLHGMAAKITRFFNNPNQAVVVSNACVSGVLGILYGQRLIGSGRYRNIIVSGGDLLSEFIVSGFLSFQSLSPEACRPFDRSRNGLSLGEGCGTIVLSEDHGVFIEGEPIRVTGGAGSNDANHISGPSRTGEGLYLAIRHALRISGMDADAIDSISAHGTATLYNDEMESKAFCAAGMENTPLNSYKAYIGHTLGAAGVIEAAISLQSMKRNLLFRSMGYIDHGVTGNINVIRHTREKQIKTCLKTGSGFGGSNAAVIFQKM
jgi:3-oxoacyl-[acyl-carrier-protein] synthase I